jgi:hypothetical protein
VSAPITHVSGTRMSMTPFFLLTFHREGGVLAANGGARGVASSLRASSARTEASLGGVRRARCELGRVDGTSSTWASTGQGHRREPDGVDRWMPLAGLGR